MEETFYCLLLQGDNLVIITKDNCVADAVQEIGVLILWHIQIMFTRDKAEILHVTRTS